MKLSGSINTKITKDKNGENVTHLEITELVLAHCNIPNNDHQHESKDLYIILPHKSLSQLLDISSGNFIFLKIFNSEFSCIEVWLADQNSKPLKIEDKISITLVIN